MPTMLRIGLLLLFLAGCSSDPRTDAVVDLCTRLDGCNFLPAGVSVQECIDDRAACVDRLNPSQTDDWVELMEHCMELRTCPLLGECWIHVPWC